MLKTIQEVIEFNLRRLRGKRTQSEVAEAAGIPLRTYQDAEGGHIPRPSTITALSQAFKVSETELFLDPDLKRCSPQGHARGRKSR